MSRTNRREKYCERELSSLDWLLDGYSIDVSISTILKTTYCPKQGAAGVPTTGTFPRDFVAYTRLPKSPDKCPVSGLCRSTIVSLISGPNPLVKSKLLKQPGAKRGIRLIDVSSLLAYLHGLPDASAEFNQEGRDHV
jgi:hypothetical protein